MRLSKLSKRDLEKVWKIADVKNIPQGWRRIVYYDKQEKKFWGMLITSPTQIDSPKLVKVGEFISLRDYIRKEIPEEIFKVTDEEALEYYEYDFMNGYYYPPAQWTFWTF